MTDFTNDSKEAFADVLSGYYSWLTMLEDMSTDDFWYEFYNADEDANGFYVGYVGANNDEDGTIFVDWWLERAYDAYAKCKTILDKE